MSTGRPGRAGHLHPPVPPGRTAGDLGFHGLARPAVPGPVRSSPPGRGRRYAAGPYDRECIGYSSSTAVIFSNQTYSGESLTQQRQDERVRFDEQQIFQWNVKADQAHQATGRTEVGLVYFAGITEGAGEDYDSGQAEELEGLLAAQQTAYASGVSVPVLKVVVANGGSKMQDAVPVARMLLPLFRQDRDMLGVVGLDRSTTPVDQAIDTLTRIRSRCWRQRYRPTGSATVTRTISSYRRAIATKRT